MIKLYYNQHQQDVLLQQSPLGLKKSQYFIVQGALIPLFNCQRKNHSSLFSSFYLTLNSTHPAPQLLFLFFSHLPNKMWWKWQRSFEPTEYTANKETDGIIKRKLIVILFSPFLFLKNLSQTEQPKPGNFFLNCRRSPNFSFLSYYFPARLASS